MMQARRCFHCGKANELKQVILHHVAQCTDAVIKLDAAADTQVLGYRNLHMVDGTAPPQRFE